MGEVELPITPRAGEAYIWNCFPLEPFRRRGVLRALLAGIRERAHDEGLSRLWIGSVAIPAERAFVPWGFTPALHFACELITGYRLPLAQSAAEAYPAL